MYLSKREIKTAQEVSPLVNQLIHNIDLSVVDEKWNEFATTLSYEIDSAIDGYIDETLLKNPVYKRYLELRNKENITNQELIELDNIEAEAEDIKRDENNKFQTIKSQIYKQIIEWKIN